MEDRRLKYTRDPIKNRNLKIDVKFDVTELDLMCRYIVSENKSIRRGHIINLRNLFMICDMAAYGNDQERLSRIDFILKGVTARLDYNLTQSNMIMSHICGGFGGESPIHIDKNMELNSREVEWVNQTISETLKYSIIYNDVDTGLALLTKFKSAPYKDRGSIVSDIESWVVNLNNKFRKARANKVDDLAFSLEKEEFEDSVRTTYQQLASPSNRLLFGVQALNALTGGGVESTRVYTLLGLPGEGKSSTLLDMAMQIRDYNTKYVCKDPTKRPCVVLLVMENGIKETVQRIFNMRIGKDMLNFSEDEAVSMLKEQGGMTLSDNNPINLIIRFRPNLSEDTSYLYTLCEDLEDEGYEVICLLQDYLKRIRSVEGTFGGDLRMQLGAVINEFKVFATLKDVPVITASQLNRTATSAIDEARIKNKADLVRLIGRSNVGESNLILENSDWIALIAPEFDMSTGNKYLGVQMVKSRYYIPGDFHIAYLPYLNNTIKFVEDFYSISPVHKITMRNEQLNGGTNAAQGAVKSIKEFTEFNDVKLPKDTKNNMFTNASGFAAKCMSRSVFRQNMVRTVQTKRNMCNIISR